MFRTFMANAERLWGWHRCGAAEEALPEFFLLSTLFRRCVARSLLSGHLIDIPLLYCLNLCCLEPLFLLVRGSDSLFLCGLSSRYAERFTLPLSVTTPPFRIQTEAAPLFAQRLSLRC